MKLSGFLESVAAIEEPCLEYLEKKDDPFGKERTEWDFEAEQEQKQEKALDDFRPSAENTPILLNNPNSNTPISDTSPSIIVENPSSIHFRPTGDFRNLSSLKANTSLLGIPFLLSLKALDENPQYSNSSFHSQAFFLPELLPKFPPVQIFTPDFPPSPHLSKSFMLHQPSS